MSSSKYSVRLLPAAEEDLEEIVLYIAAENVSAASELADKFKTNLKHLASHPLLGKIPDDQKLSGMGYRFIVVDNYLIFYTLRLKTILIHRIIHGARDFRYLI